MGSPPNDKYCFFISGLWEVPVVPLQTFCLASERLILYGWNPYLWDLTSITWM